MVDVNYTVLVQLANFLVLIIILNAILLKPVLRHLKERDDKISSSHEEAKSNAGRAESMLAEFEHELGDARMKAKQAYNKHQQEGVAEQRAKLADAKAKSQGIVDKAMAEIASDAAQARGILKSEMEKLPKDIASKLLGRTL